MEREMANYVQLEIQNPDSSFVCESGLKFLKFQNII